MFVGTRALQCHAELVTGLLIFATRRVRYGNVLLLNGKNLSSYQNNLHSALKHYDDSALCT